MKVIVGLGNPGREYEKTRHNVGFMALDMLAQKLHMPNAKFQMNTKFQAQILQTASMLLVRPETFMNKSGEAVARVMHFYKMEPKRLCVVHDDLDLALGTYKIHFGKGPKVHNGVTSVEEALGTKAFWRVRIGTENRSSESGARSSGEEYVLRPFLADERTVIEGVIKEVADKLMTGWEGYV